MLGLAVIVVLGGAAAFIMNLRTNIETRVAHYLDRHSRQEQVPAQAPTK